MPATKRCQLSRKVTLLSAAMFVAVTACSRSGTESPCVEYVGILTEESAFFAELAEPSASSLSPVGIALAQSETPGDRTLADIDRMVVLYDMFIEDFEAAAKRLREATAVDRRHELSGYGSDLAAVFEVLTDIYTQSRDQLQQAVDTEPERVLRGTYFVREGNINLSIGQAVLSPDPLDSFQNFTTYLVANCPTLEANLADAWLITERLRTGYRHWDTSALSSTTTAVVS